MGLVQFFYEIGLIVDIMGDVFCWLGGLVYGIIFYVIVCFDVLVIDVLVFGWMDGIGYLLDIDMVRQFVKRICCYLVILWYGRNSIDMIFFRNLLIVMLFWYVI